jgi:hypothetical protein
MRDGEARNVTLDPGDGVEVRDSLGSWAPGFEVVSTDSDGSCRVRRCDGTEVPAPLAGEMVRPATR